MSTATRLDAATLPRLLAGLDGPDGLRGLARHVDVHGELPIEAAPGRPDPALLEQVRAAGLGGRGGAMFPVSRKIEAVLSQRGRPVVVINCAEGEPPSRKDHVLMRGAPHLIIDGAIVCAALVGADEVTIALEEGSRREYRVLEEALDERAALRLDTVDIDLATVPDGFVVGEERALINALEGGPGRPYACAAAAVREGSRRCADTGPERRDCRAARADRALRRRSGSGRWAPTRSQGRRWSPSPARSRIRGSTRSHSARAFRISWSPRAGSRHPCRRTSSVDTSDPGSAHATPSSSSLPTPRCDRWARPSVRARSSPCRRPPAASPRPRGWPGTWPSSPRASADRACYGPGRDRRRHGAPGARGRTSAARHRALAGDGQRTRGMPASRRCGAAHRERADGLRRGDPPPYPCAQVRRRRDAGPADDQANPDPEAGMSERLSIDWIRCDAHGLCAELFPERITLDDWGYPIIDAKEITPQMRAHAARAVAQCPILALRLDGPAPETARRPSPGRRTPGQGLEDAGGPDRHLTRDPGRRLRRVRGPTAGGASRGRRRGLRPCDRARGRACGLLTSERLVPMSKAAAHTIERPAARATPIPPFARTPRPARHARHGGPRRGTRRRGARRSARACRGGAAGAAGPGAQLRELAL